MGVTQQVSGLGCVIFNFLRFLTGCEAQWVEGWTIPEEAANTEDDCGAYGRIGFSGGFVCSVPQPDEIVSGAPQVSLLGTEGRIWLSRPHPILVQGKGVLAPRISPMGPRWHWDTKIPLFHTFAVEYMVHMPVPEWGRGKHLYICIHDGAVVTERGMEYPYPPINEIHIIK